MIPHKLGGSQGKLRDISSAKTFYTIKKGRCIVKKKKLLSGEKVAVKKFINLEINALRELHCLSALKDNNLFVQILDIKIVGYDIYIIMPCYTGDLEDFCNKIPFPIRIEVYPQFQKEAFLMLYNLYHHKILHLDIKPQNILVDWDLDFEYYNSLYPSDEPIKVRFYLADFSASYQKISDDMLENVEENMYTCGYRSPEVLLKRQNCSYPSELWAMACVFIFFLINEPLVQTLFDDKNNYAYLNYIDSLTVQPGISYTLENIDSIHNHIDIGRLLESRINSTQLQLLTEYMDNLESLLQINPKDRPCITELIEPEPKLNIISSVLINIPQHMMIPYVIICEWLISISYTFQTSISVIISAIDLLERCLTSMEIKLDDLQLLSIVCLSLCDKMLSDNFILAEDLVKTSEPLFTINDIRQWEIVVLKFFNYIIISRAIDNTVRSLEKYNNPWKILRDTYFLLIKDNSLSNGSISYKKFF